jgi:hypothetical protein
VVVSHCVGKQQHPNSADDIFRLQVIIFSPYYNRIALLGYSIYRTIIFSNMRLYFLDNLRFALTILVVFHHTAIAYGWFFLHPFAP